MFSASKTAVVGGYRIANSLRFRSSASAYLSRVITLSATWTLSLWVKRGKLGVTAPIFGSSVGFNSNDTLTAGTLTTTAVYRDPSSWYHIVVSNNGCYINGVSVGSVTTGILVNPSIGNYLTNYFDGYLADIYLIDGSALSATSFGQFNATTGVWGPKQYVGSYGSAGFHLSFSNGTSTTTLGYDSSGNGNNWTTNNISLTAGSTYDWMIDSPTPYQGSSYGVGNYAVLNPLDSAGGAISGGNLDATITGQYIKKATFGVSSGKWYWETTQTSSGDLLVGIVLTTVSPTVSQFVGQGASQWGYYGANGYKYTGGSGTAYGATYTTNDVIGIALDADAGTLTFYKNGTSQGTAFSSLSGTFTAAFSGGGGAGANSSVNFGQRPFSYTPPSGYKSLCTYNLPTPTIQNGAGYMAATLYTGNGSTQSISNAVNSVSFKPDFVWLKQRTTVSNHGLFDSVRGAGYDLRSNTTAVENYDLGVSSFDTGGFTLGGVNWNDSAVPIVGWQWKAGGTAVTNTAGSITSSVSANMTSGFSVVTYTGNGSSGATVGHGLGVALGMIIIKNRVSSYNWRVGHSALPSWSYFLQLDGTNAQNSNNVIFNGVAPTSSVFTLGNDVSVNASGQSHVAYCFAAIPGYSAFGSYTGNGSSDGPFVYCGFRPRFVLLKGTTTAGGSWIMLDTSRSTYNVVASELYANLSDAEASVSRGDILSNGYKLRTTSGSFNTNGDTYIYAAFAENPFTNALAR